MVRQTSVTNAELEKYQRVRDMQVDSKDKQEFMRMVADKAVNELIKQRQSVNNK